MHVCMTVLQYACMTILHVCKIHMKTTAKKQIRRCDCMTQGWSNDFFKSVCLPARGVQILVNAQSAPFCSRWSLRNHFSENTSCVWTYSCMYMHTYTYTCIRGMAHARRYCHFTKMMFMTAQNKESLYQVCMASRKTTFNEHSTIMCGIKLGIQQASKIRIQRWLLIRITSTTVIHACL
jgi:hypothetical protein